MGSYPFLKQFWYLVQCGEVHIKSMICKTTFYSNWSLLSLSIVYLYMPDTGHATLKANLEISEAKDCALFSIIYSYCSCGFSLSSLLVQNCDCVQYFCTYHMHITFCACAEHPWWSLGEWVGPPAIATTGSRELWQDSRNPPLSYFDG